MLHPHSLFFFFFFFFFFKISQNVFCCPRPGKLICRTRWRCRGIQILNHVVKDCPRLPSSLDKYIFFAFSQSYRQTLLSLASLLSDFDRLLKLNLLLEIWKSPTPACLTDSPFLKGKFCLEIESFGKSPDPLEMLSEKKHLWWQEPCSLELWVEHL